MSTSGSRSPVAFGALGVPFWRPVLSVALAAVFVWNVWQHRFVSDDAYISFRYADNLVRGEGLVWNPGERVEGYTNFLWVLIMAASLWVGIPPERTSVVLGIASGIALLCVIAYVWRRRYGRLDAAGWLLLFVLACHRSFTAWSTSGLENMFFALLGFSGVVRFLHEREEPDARPIGSALLFAAATLTRPEGALFAGIAGLIFLGDVARKRSSLGRLTTWVVVLGGIVGGHEAFRLAYYGEWLPNTFYAKVSGAWFEQAVRYFALFHREYGAFWFLPLLVPAVWSKDAFVERVFLVVVGLYAAYLLYIGGDRFEFRFLVILSPFLYWLVAAGLRALVVAAPDRAWVSWAARLVGAALLVSTILGGREVHGVDRHGIAGIGGIRGYARARARQGKLLRQLVDDGRLPRDLVIAVGGAGALPYYTRWTAVDCFGLSDERIARMPIAKRGVVAHEHEPTWAYLVERRVVVYDALNQLIHQTPEPMHAARGRKLGGRELEWRAVRLDRGYLVFATFVSDAELERAFSGFEVLK